MWGSVLVLSLPAALNPARLAITLLLTSRPRPVQNLFACWLGNLTSSIPVVVLPLTLLHATPMFDFFADGLARSATGRYIQAGIGAVALLVVALMIVRSLTSRRAQPSTPSGGGRHRIERVHGNANTSTLVVAANVPPVVAANVPPAISRLTQRAADARREDGSLFRRLLARAHDAWEGGALWVAFVAGLANPPAPDVAVLVVAIIVASGATIGTQVAAAIVFVVAVLALLEITLVSYVIAPSKTETILQVLHEWALANRRKILMAMLAVLGVSLVASGIGGG